MNPRIKIKRNQRGIYTIADISEIMKIPPSTVNWHLHTHLELLPTVSYNNSKRKYYSAEDVETFKAYWQEWQEFLAKSKKIEKEIE